MSTPNVKAIPLLHLYKPQKASHLQKGQRKERLVIFYNIKGGKQVSYIDVAEAMQDFDESNPDGSQNGGTGPRLRDEAIA